MNINRYNNKFLLDIDFDFVFNLLKIEKLKIEKKLNLKYVKKIANICF